MADEFADVLGFVVAELEREGVGTAADLAHVLQLAQGSPAAAVAGCDVVLQVIFL